MFTKSCPRCKRGDIFIEQDHTTPDFVCLQCGWRGDKIRIIKNRVLFAYGGKKLRKQWVLIGQQSYHQH